jgi:hypothetical protein
MPGLIDLKTDLKSLKYGHDTPGGGNSGQPYITTDINTVDSGFNKFRLTKFDDGLVRGGIIGAVNASAVDTLRIGKFLTDFPKGPLFIVKQVGLQLSNPRLESKKLRVDRATRGQGFLNNIGNFISNVAGRIENAVGPTRIYNLGINTLAQVPINAIGGHVIRHGFLPVQDSSKLYEAVVTANNKNDTNRLVELNERFSSGRNSLIVNQYIGGPGSVYGIGTTIIHRATTPKDNNIIGNYSSAESGRPLVDGQRQAFSYIDQGTLDGAVTSDLGQRNKFSDWNKSHNIGGVEYLNKGLVDVFYDTETSPTELAKGVDQSVYNSNYQTPYTNPKRVLSYTNANVNFSSGSFFGASNYASSSLSPFYFDTTGSISSNSNNNRKSIDVKTAVPSDRSNAIRKQVGNNINDLSINGPSLSYPGIDTGSINATHSLDLPNLVYGVGKSTYSHINAKVNHLTAPNNLGIYDKLINGQKNLNRSPSSTYNPTYRNSYGEKVVINIPWKDATREKRISSGRQDGINLTPLFDEGAYFGADTSTNPNANQDNIRDLIRFRIQAVNTDNPESGTWMVFRAYITDLSDDVSANWNEVKYAGRGDQFWIYNGFTRKMSVSFKVAALSAGEMKPMYNKLNYLMSNLMPDYKFTNNVMRGPLVRMSIGSYIDSQLCKLDSLNYKVSNDTPWEIAIDKPEKGAQLLILPHIIEVTLSFTPIGSESRGKNELPRKADCVSNIAQNNTGDTQLQYVNDCAVVKQPDPEPLPDPEPAPDPEPDPQPIYVPLPSPLTPTLKDNTRVALVDGPGGGF